MGITFMEILEQRGIISREMLYQKALDHLKSDGVPDTEENRQDYVEALTDAYFANSFGPVEIESYINLARKRDQAQTLSMVANRDQATSMEIYKALREFCEIPKGEVYISPEEAIGIRVALISRFISNQLPFISLAKNHVTIRDMDLILQRALWSRRRPGRLGGKAAGMILAYKILLPLWRNTTPRWKNTCGCPDTWYLNSGVFSEFLDRNNLYLFHTFKYKDREEIEKEFLHVEEKFKYRHLCPRGDRRFPQDPGGDRGTSHHHPVLQPAGRQLRPGFLREVPFRFPDQPGRPGDPPEPFHPRAEAGLRQHLRARPHPLPHGPWPAGLRRTDGHGGAEGGGPAGGAIISSPLFPGSSSPATSMPGTPRSKRRKGWDGWFSGWERGPWTGWVRTTPGWSPSAIPSCVRRSPPRRLENIPRSRWMCST